MCPCLTGEKDPFIPGKANVLKEGAKIAIFAAGLMIAEALEAAKLLEQAGCSTSVVNFHTIKPFDADTARSIAKKTGAVLTVEEHSIIGGLGSAAAEALAGMDGIKFERIGIMDKFGKSGKPKDLFREYGLNADTIVECCKKLAG